MGPLQLAVTWYKIHHAGEQATHWDIQKKENCKFVLMKSLCSGCPSGQLALSELSEFELVISKMAT